MSTTKRLLLGALAIGPLIYFSIVLASMLAFVGSLGSRSVADRASESFWVIFPLHAFMLMATAVMIAIYLMHAMKNKGLSDSRRALWMASLGLLGVLTAPVYWWLYVWRVPPAQSYGEPG